MNLLSENYLYKINESIFTIKNGIHLNINNYIYESVIYIFDEYLNTSTGKILTCGIILTYSTITILYGIRTLNKINNESKLKNAKISESNRFLRLISEKNNEFNLNSSRPFSKEFVVVNEKYFIEALKKYSNYLENYTKLQNRNDFKLNVKGKIIEINKLIDLKLKIKLENIENLNKTIKLVDRRSRFSQNEGALVLAYDQFIIAFTNFISLKGKEITLEGEKAEEKWEQMVSDFKDLEGTLQPCNWKKGKSARSVIR